MTAFLERLEKTRVEKFYQRHHKLWLQNPFILCEDPSVVPCGEIVELGKIRTRIYFCICCGNTLISVSLVRHSK
jgi:hypothetical protein